MCVDYRAFKEVTMKNKYIFFQIDDFFLIDFQVPKCLVRLTYVQGITKFELQKEMKNILFVTQGMTLR